MTHSDAFPDLPENLPGFDPDPARPLALFQALGLDLPTPFEVVNLPDGMPLWLKDESQRMGLGAFKALGAPYAVARLIAHHWAAAGRGRLSPDRMTHPDVRDFAADLTFVAASAGNHGMGVAAGAEMFGARARIYLAETVPQGFDARLQARGAVVVRAGADYEASMQAALADAEESAKQAADQTHRFFLAGRESFLADLQATRTYTDVTAQLAAANTQVAMGQIDLFLALGGGWENSRPAQSPEQAQAQK